MAKSARAAEKPPKQRPALRPVLLAAGLGLVWFVEFQEAGGPVAGAPAWGDMAIVGVRLLVDFIGGWLVVSGLTLAFAALRLALTYVRARWLREGA